MKQQVVVEDVQQLITDVTRGALCVENGAGASGVGALNSCVVFYADENGFINIGSTDLQDSVSVKAFSLSDYVNPFSDYFWVNAAQLKTLLGTLKGEVTITYADGRLSFKGRRGSSASLQCNDSDTWGPYERLAIQHPDPERGSIKTSAKMLSSALGNALRVLPSKSEMPRYQCAVIYTNTFGKTICWGTASPQIGCTTFTDATGSLQVTKVQRDSCKRVVELLKSFSSEAEVCFGKTQSDNPYVTGPGFVFTTRELGYNAPNYEQLCEKFRAGGDIFSVKVSKKELKEVASKLLPASGYTDTPGNAFMRFRAIDGEVAELSFVVIGREGRALIRIDSFEGSYEGEDIHGEVMIRLDAVSEAVNIIRDETINLSLNATCNGLFVTGSESADGYFALITTITLGNAGESLVSVTDDEYASFKEIEV